MQEAHRVAQQLLDRVFLHVAGRPPQLERLDAHRDRLFGGEHLGEAGVLAVEIVLLAIPAGVPEIGPRGLQLHRHARQPPALDIVPDDRPARLYAFVRVLVRQVVRALGDAEHGRARLDVGAEAEQELAERR
jgi:hypothetical protein